MLHVIRIIFIILCGVIGWYVGDSYNKPFLYSVVMGAGVGVALTLLELAFARRFIATVSTVMFGVVFGFVMAHFFISALYLIPSISDLPVEERRIFEFCITFLFSFIAVVAIIHTKDDFKIAIPFIELSKEGATNKPIILDTSAIIDGRIADICKTKVIDAEIVIPRFVLDELQAVADSADKLKRMRGRRGLDMLNKMREEKGLNIQINEAVLPYMEAVDSKLIKLAKMLTGRIVTTDFNLSKVAQVQGVEVINVNDIANALRPVVLQGEKLTIKIMKPGEGPGQGVGYLDDGTMVVAEGCANRIGERLELLITNVLQTSAGRMIFGKPS